MIRTRIQILYREGPDFLHAPAPQAS